VSTIAAVAGLSVAPRFRRLLRLVGATAGSRSWKICRRRIICGRRSLWADRNASPYGKRPELWVNGRCSRLLRGSIFQTKWHSCPAEYDRVVGGNRSVCRTIRDWRSAFSCCSRKPTLLLAHGDRCVGPGNRRGRQPVTSRQADLLIDLTHDVNPRRRETARVMIFGLTEHDFAGRSATPYDNGKHPTITYAPTHVCCARERNLYFGAARRDYRMDAQDTLTVETFSIQALTIAITAIGALQSIRPAGRPRSNSTAQSLRAAMRILWACGLSGANARTICRYARPPVRRIRIVLTHVSFRYQGDLRPQCRISTRLPAGSIVRWSARMCRKETWVKLR